MGCSIAALKTLDSGITNRETPAIRLADAASQIRPETSSNSLVSPRRSATRAAFRLANARLA
eukprot:762558-Alexandrium_andersonii.AAC.1